MSILEKNIERDNLIDGFFNKGYACDLDEVYEAVIGTIKDLEEANDNKIKQIDQLTNNWQLLEEYIEVEKTRFAKECSHIYEDSLGKTKKVNEDIFNELNNILDKMKEIKGDKE